MVLKLNPITGDLDLVGSGGGSAGLTDLTGDVGTAVSPDGSDNIDLIGDATQAYIETTGTPASNKMEIKLTKPSIDGQLLIGHTANGSPSVATLTAGSGIDITNGAGTITVASTATSSLSAPTDSGTAVAVAGVMSFVGGTGADTAGSGNTVTINSSADVPTAFTTDSGTGTPAGNSLAINGGTGINTSGAGAGVTVNLDDPVIASLGGSGRQSHTEYALICGGTTTTSAQQSIASVGTANQLLTSNGAGALPTFQVAPSAESLPTSLTAGSVVFSDGSNLTQDNANLFWDDTNNRLGIGTNTPVDELHVVGGIDLVHTADQTDDHALEITCDAAGFGDVKGIEIDFITGAITAGFSEEAILVNIDESLSVGGEVFGIEILSTALGTAKAYGTKHGATVNPILQEAGTFADADSILNKAVDVTAALADGGAGNISIFVADNDTVTIGDAATYGELEILIDTGASGAGISPTYEFSTGAGTWTIFAPSDGTNGFKNTGLVSWETSSIPTWVAVGGEYLIRITRTKNSLSTTPIVDLIQVSAITNYEWDKNGLISINKIVAHTNLTVGNTTEDTTFTVNGAAITSTISAESSNASTLGGLISHRHSSTAGFGGHYLGLRSRGTHASPTVVQDNDVLSIAATAGHDGTDYALAAQISVEVDGTPGSNDMPGRIVMSTSADGAQTPTEGIRLDSNQIVTLANALPETSGGTNQATYTTGDTLYSDGANSLEKLGIGSTGEVLTVAGGVPTWAASAAGSTPPLLTTQTASVSTSLDFTSSIDSTYNTYLFIFDDIVSSIANTSLVAETSSDGGATWGTSTNDYNQIIHLTAPGIHTIGIPITTSITIFGLFSAFDMEIKPVSGMMYLYNPSALSKTKFRSTAGGDIGIGATITAADTTGSGFTKSALALNAIRFKVIGGTITTGTIKMYGLTTP